MAQSEDERKRSEAAKKAAETRRKNQEDKEREAGEPHKDTTPSAPVDAGPESARQAPESSD